jgi:hypothetical protein
MAVAAQLLTVVILIPGLAAPVISLSGRLDPQGVRAIAPRLLDQGLSESTVNAVRPFLNPALLPVLDATPGGVKGALVGMLGAQLGDQLAAGPEIEVYHQTRSIVGSVRHLYRVGSPLAASLILLFSVIVPLTKAALVLGAVVRRDAVRRRRTLNFVELIAKWSMADVFAVALFIAYLAARASQTPPSGDFVPQAVTFTATFGPGFYWFAGYCLASLGVQQATARWLMAEQGGPGA